MAAESASGMKALIIGCGRVGSSIAIQLQSEGWEVSSSTRTRMRCRASATTGPATFLVGHGIDTDLLREAGIEDADAVIAATDGDNTNIVIGEVAEKRFDVKLRRRPGARSGARGVLLGAGHAHGLPDEDRDRHAPRDRRGLARFRRRTTA